MNTTERITQSLINDPMSAAQITQNLNLLGGGKGMRAGIARIVTYHTDKASTIMDEHFIAGMAVGGATCLVVVLVLWSTDKARREKETSAHVNERETTYYVQDETQRR